MKTVRRIGGWIPAVEAERRELETTVYVVPDESFFEDLQRIIVPSTHRHYDEKKDWTVGAAVCDQAQLQIKDDDLKCRLRRTLSLSTGETLYTICMKAGKGGDNIEVECDIAKNDGFSLFNLWKRNSKEAMYKTRVSKYIRLAGDEDNGFSLEIDVPLLTGDHCRDLDATWGKVLKIDAEYDKIRPISSELVLSSLPFPVQRVISDKEEIHELYKTQFRRTLK